MKEELEKELITIIVPIYKVEKYIEKCVNSVINQTYKNLEIILVDDGSPDKCGEICEKYAQEDKRIKVIHQKNGGLSAARNSGLDIATGSYILLVDSDDYIENYTVESLYNLSQKYQSEITIGSTNLVYEDQQIEDKSNIIDEKIKTYNKEQALEAMLYNTEFTNNAWNKLYKAELFKDIRYPFGKLYEDLATTYKLIAKSNKVVLTSKITYNYLMDRSGSIMNKQFKKERMDALTFTEEILAYIRKNHPNIEKSAIARLYMECIFILLKIPKTREYSVENKKIKQYIRRYRMTVLTDAKMPIKQKMLCFATLGGRNLVKLAWQVKEKIKRKN